MHALARAFARAVLRSLLALYPRPFRDRFGTDLETALDDRLDVVWRRSTVRALACSARVALDLASAGILERLRPAFRAPSATDASTIRSRRGSPMSTLLRDIRFALRSLSRRPAFTLVALFTLALGIGASTAVFTVVDGVLLQPLPFPDSDELVIVWAFDTDVGRARGWMSQPDIDDVRRLPTVAGVEGIMTTGTSVTGVERPERIEVARSTGGLLDLLGIPPQLGRDLDQADNDPESARVVVISHGFWQSRLGGDPDVIGTTLELDERVWEIVGVAPEGFGFPEGVSVWQPYRLDVGDGCGRGCHVYEGAIVRLSDGTNLALAQESLDGLAAALGEEYPDWNIDKGFWLEPLLDYQVGDVRTGLWVVLGAVGLVLLIVCANTANLLLVRASTRGREVAVRAALGASGKRLFVQVVTESLLLAGLGGAIGLGLALGLLEGIRVLAADRVPRMAEVGLDLNMLLALVALTLSVALIFGLSPAVHLARRGGAHNLLGGARGGARSAGSRIRSLLLAGEVAFSVVLLVGSGLLLRSLDELYDVDLGFDGARVTRFTLSLPYARYDELATIVPFYRDLEQRLFDHPAVESTGSVYGAPLAGGNISGTVLVEGRPEPAPGEETGASMRPVTPGYFGTMGMTLLRGRGIEPTDETGTEPVAVVNETFVARNFPGEDVIGARIRVTASFGYGSPYWRVVGVVADVRRSLSGEPTAEVYPPHAQYGPGFMTVHVRARPGSGSLAYLIRDEVESMDPNLVLRGVETVEEAKHRDTASTRLFLTLLTIFAGVAVVLASVGLYGVVAFLVAQRTREIGIRMALGAGRANVTRLVLRQGLAPTLLGVLAGVGIALQGGQVIRSLLFRVEPSDPLVLIVVSALVVSVATCATLLPARRATRVDPTQALNVE
jgi:putative ABC transport system permease protein